MLNKIDPNILHNVHSLDKNDGTIECIVYADNYNNTKNFLVNVLKYENIIEYPFINGFGVKADFDTVTKLANFEAVNYITLNTKVTTSINVSKKVLNIMESPLNLTKVPKFTVAIIDTGVAGIIDLMIPKKRIVHFEDFVNERTICYDDNGHGTFIASVLAGNGLVSGRKYVGVDDTANIIALKALDDNGETGAFTILKAMQWIYDNRRKFNIRVVCMSFGSNTIGKKDPLLIGAEVLWNAGICVVCAAGNSGPDYETIKSPGASSRIITVGALNDNRKNDGTFLVDEFDVANFSSRGPILGTYKPDLIAPGVNIVSACNYVISKEHYRKMSGTSVATPMVAGICSLLININPNLTPNEIKSIIIKNCKKITGDRNAEGFGLLDVGFIFNNKKHKR